MLVVDRDRGSSYAINRLGGSQMQKREESGFTLCLAKLVLRRLEDFSDTTGFGDRLFTARNRVGLLGYRCLPLPVEVEYNLGDDGHWAREL